MNKKLTKSSLLIATIISAVIGLTVDVNALDNTIYNKNTQISYTKTVQPETPPVFTVGDSVASGGLTTTLIGVTESTGSKYNEPKEGKIFVIVEFEIQNNKNSDVYVSSMDFHASCDMYSIRESYKAESELEDDIDTIGGSVFPNQRIRGIIGYELPINWEVLEIHFEASSNDKDMVIFKIPHNPQ